MQAKWKLHSLSTASTGSKPGHCQFPCTCKIPQRFRSRRIPGRTCRHGLKIPTHQTLSNGAHSHPIPPHAAPTKICEIHHKWGRQSGSSEDGDRVPSRQTQWSEREGIVPPRQTVQSTENSCQRHLTARHAMRSMAGQDLDRFVKRRKRSPPMRPTQNW